MKVNKSVLLGMAAAVGLMATPAMAGSISGSVNFKGDVPPVGKYAITKNPEICGTGTRSVEWVRVKGGKLSQAVVYIAKIDGPKKFSDDATNAKSNQKGCEFLPYLQVVKNGASYEALNSDPVLHNIHTYEIIGRAKRTMFNVSQPDKGFVYNDTIKMRRGKWMKLECDAHDFMHGWVFAAKTPYYATTGDDGAFNITEVPDGEYEVVAYHPTLGKQTATVKVSGNSKASFTFTQ